MGEIRVPDNVEFKKAVELYLKEGMGYKTSAKELGIKAVISSKRSYHGKKEAYVISDNHLNRDFQVSRPNEEWVTDITYLIFNGQRLYLSPSKDLYNNKIVAYETSRRNNLKLVLDTFKKEKKKRNVTGIFLHGD